MTYTYDNGAGCVQSDTFDLIVNSSTGCTPSNVALGGTASQSSTYGNGVASLAIDGNTTGTSPWSADLQHTQNESTPWWEVDLGSEHDIEDVVIYNRTDKLQSRLRDFYVFVSVNPFPVGASLNDLIGDTGISNQYFSGPAGLQETVSLNTNGRYLRIQLSGSGTLHMAEVEVMGCPSSPSPCDGEPPVTITPSGPFLDTDPVQTLVGSPVGGTWSGASTDGTFDPSIGPGTYPVTYTYDNGAGCVQSDTFDLIVNSSTGCTPSNVALGGTASQSSTYGNGVASLAIDGNTTGTSPWSADLQHTQNESTPWWEVDLGSEHDIEDVVIYNRTDKLQSRLRDFYVFVSVNPFPVGASLNDLIGDTGISNQYFSGPAGLQETVSLNTNGRYLRIQLSGSGTLHMAEVEVMGCPTGGSPLKVDSAIISDGITERPDIRLVPNPASEAVHFEVTGTSEVLTLAVYDVDGRLVHRVEFGTSSPRRGMGVLDISDLAKGVYHFHFTLSNGSRYAKKLIKN